MASYDAPKKGRDNKVTVYDAGAPRPAAGPNMARPMSQQARRAMNRTTSRRGAR